MTLEQYQQSMAELGISRAAFAHDREFAESPAHTPVSQRLRPPGTPAKRMTEAQLARYRAMKARLKAKSAGKRKGSTDAG